MGELRYFPGFEPRSGPAEDDHGPSSGAAGSPRQPHADATSGETEPGHAAPGPTTLTDTASGDAAPGWAVPGLGGPRPIDDRSAGEPAAGDARVHDRGVHDRGVHDPGAHDPGAGHPSRGSRRAEHVSMSAITTHDVSEAELRTRLAARGLDQADIDAEIRRVVAVGLVDDAALAARLVQTLRQRKGLGDGAIRPALRTRRIPQAVIDAVLLQHADDQATVQDRLQDVADDRARRLVNLQPQVAERRLAAFLARKGYSGLTVRAATRLALERARGSA